MKTILVTGSAGFMGRALTQRLAEAGNRVIEFDLEQGDLSKPGALAILAHEKPDHVYHLAGKTFVPDSWNDPSAFYQVNVMGTVNVLELCRQTGARLTYVSSYLYGEPDYLPIDENHPLKSYNPYSHTKLLADSACRFYADNYKITVTILRPFNAYGPGQPGQFLISEIIGKTLNPAVPVIEVMDLRPKRDYVYIDDIVRALMLTMHAPVGIFNIGSGISISVEEIIKQTMKIAGINKEYRGKGNFRPNEILDLYADIRNARAELGWQPVVSFEAGLKNCILSYHSKH